MNDKEFIEIYKKGIKYQYKTNFIISFGVLFANVIFILIYIKGESLDFIFKSIGITFLVAILLVLLFTPIQWERMKRRYESIIKSQEINSDNIKNK
ncbi:MAG: hypothetical protein K0Q49_966 [Haloplasmataceae bacterium]|nr:hypothetical protein [Haloplasmataceae bacterium]